MMTNVNELFNIEKVANKIKRNTSRKTEEPKGKKAFPFFCRSLLKVLVSLGVIYFVGPWFFLIKIFAFFSLISGISDVLKNARLMAES